MRSSRCKSAFTLMEVVVGLVLMASVLVASLLAFSAHRKQLRNADAKIAAISIADELLYRLSESRDGIPLSATGPIANQPNWFWRTRPTGNIVATGVPVRVIRFEIVESNGQTIRVLTSVDVVEAAT